VSVPVVLDAGGLETLSAAPSTRFRALLGEALRRDSAVLVPAVVCAEVCRGVKRTRAVEAALGRHNRRRGERPAVMVVPTDFTLARAVGAILHAASANSGDIVDAHCVALCAVHGGGLVITGDPDDIFRLASAVPAVRVTVRGPG
jgi:predicted nucleic acid-binding protein